MSNVYFCVFNCIGLRKVFMDSKNQVQKIILLITLPVVLLLFFNQIAFQHYHILENGLIIEHSHPFNNNPVKGTPYQSHNHTDFEYTVLAQISQITGFLLLLFFFERFLRVMQKSGVTAYKSRLISLSPLATDPLRGPPSL